MNILLTNNRLDFRGGAESFLKNWARGLQALGHRVIAYSGDLGPAYRRLEDDGVPVTMDVEHLPFVPDIIHAQHHLDAMAALTALPGVPAIYQCHGAVWQDCPPVHPRIYRYLAVSDTLAERIAVEFGIEPSTIDILLNGVDTERFRVVRCLPARPMRALVFNYRHHQDSDTVRAIGAAASRCGLSLDVVGPERGNWIDEPADTLPLYDIVFASGISAIEALACGCAVVVIGRTSCGELVQPENYDRFRRVNFSIPVNSPPPDAAVIEAQLRRYRPDGCGAVSARLRGDADYRSSMPPLARLYGQVIDQHRRSPVDLRAELASVSTYLQTLSPVVGMSDAMKTGRWAAGARAHSRGELKAELGRIAEALDAFD